MSVVISGPPPAVSTTALLQSQSRVRPRAMPWPNTVPAQSAGSRRCPDAAVILTQCVGSSSSSQRAPSVRDDLSGAGYRCGGVTLDLPIEADGSGFQPSSFRGGANRARHAQLLRVFAHLGWGLPRCSGPSEPKHQRQRGQPRSYTVHDQAGAMGDPHLPNRGTESAPCPCVLPAARPRWPLNPGPNSRARTQQVESFHGSRSRWRSRAA